MAYTDQQEYSKHLKHKTCSGENHGNGCGCKPESEDCSCCPPGLVAVYDRNNTHVGCLTPNDAVQYNKELPCLPGSIKMFQGDIFMGCVTEAEYAAIYAALNPAV